MKRGENMTIKIRTLRRILLAASVVIASVVAFAQSDDLESENSISTFENSPSSDSEYDLNAPVQSRDVAAKNAPIILQPARARDESELQVQQQLFVPDRKSTRERKTVNLETTSEE